MDIVSSGGGVLYIPPGGNNLIPKLFNIIYVSNISIIPAHQAGRAFDVAEIIETVRSILDPTLVANLTPTVNPINAVITVAVVINSIVLGRRSNIRSITFLLPSLVFNVRASPRSRIITFPMV